MGIRTILKAVQYTCLTAAALSLFVVLFVIGDTDLLEEPSPWVPVAFTIVAALGAIVGGIIQWVGLPAPEKEADPKKK